MLDVALSCFELVDLRLIDVETHAPKTGSRERTNQRQTHVAQADDANDGLLVLNQLGESRVTRDDR